MISRLLVRTLPHLAGLLAGAFWLVGCGSMGPNARIKEKPEVFAQLAAEDQSAIKQGLLDRGYTPEMVYLALGEPTIKENIATEKGGIEAWTYKRYYGTYAQMIPDSRSGELDIVAQHGSTGSVVGGTGGAPSKGPTMAPSERGAPVGVLTDGGRQPRILTVYFIDQKVVEATLKS